MQSNDPSDPSDPTESGEPPSYGDSNSDPEAVRPMSAGAALMWSSGVILGFWLLASLMRSSEPDLIGAFACQAAAMLFGLFLILRAHAPMASIRRFLGVRPAHPAFYPLALLLGLSVHVPADTIYRWIEQRWPSSPQTLPKFFQESSLPKQIAMGCILIVLGPLIEEIFFRGALFRPLRKQNSAFTVIAVTSACFAIAHAMPQTYLPIALVGISIGMARLCSGSFIPPLLVHAAFNALSLYAMATSPTAENTPDEPIPLWLTLSGTAMTVSVLAGFIAIGKYSSLSLEAQKLDTQ